MHSLPVFLRLEGRPVILVGDGEAAEAKRRLLGRAGARVVDEGDARARIAIVALDHEVEAEAVASRLKARGILVNVTDRPALCDFTLPAIVDRDPVIIAVGTGGASAGLAAALRQRLEGIIPDRIAALARDLFAARDELRKVWPDPGERRRALADGFAPGGLLDPLGDNPDVEEWLSSKGARPLSEKTSILLTSADPDEMTLRTARLLSQADRVLHHPDVPSAILARARADAETVALQEGKPIPSDRPGLTVILKITSL